MIHVEISPDVAGLCAGIRGKYLHPTRIWVDANVGEVNPLVEHAHRSAQGRPNRGARVGQSRELGSQEQLVGLLGGLLSPPRPVLLHSIGEGLALG
jgi:hypothetical protein